MKEEKILSEEEVRVIDSLLLEAEIKELVIRKGDALPLREPIKIDISGNIDAVARFVENRKDEFDHKQSHVLIDRDNMKIVIIFAETSYFSGKVKGVAVIDRNFLKWEINTGKSWTTFELADFIRMHRSFFENTGTAVELVSQLRNFKAKVNKELENADDKRGNRDIVKRQVVESNIPASFKINIEIFKGFSPQIIDVEIDIDADSLNCKLVSPQAAEIYQRIADSIIDDQLNRITELAPDILQIEV